MVKEGFRNKITLPELTARRETFFTTEEANKQGKGRVDTKKFGIFIN